MVVDDAIYGRFAIEQVLVELLHSAPVQRLKRVHQGGAIHLVNPRLNVTRYEHSVGVMLLIRKLGGSLEEQIAGLLHDVSHTAFSHVVDYVFVNREEDFHERIFEQVIGRSEIPDILLKYGYDVSQLLQKEWPLLDMPLPELSADRIDYTLRDMCTYGYIDKQELDWFLAALTVREGKIVVRSGAAAAWFVSTYYKLVIDFFLDPLHIYAGNRLANVLSLAWKEGFITTDDFLLDDTTLLGKLYECGEPEIAAAIRSIQPAVNVREDEEDYDIHQRNKVRIIDPTLLLETGELIASSQDLPAVRDQNERALQKALKGTFVKIVSC